MELTEFLLARIAEDEAAVCTYESEWSPVIHVGDTALLVDDEYASIIIDPARVLAECDAKRRIVEFYGGPVGSVYALRFLALPYAGHSDYDETWRP